MSKTKICIIGLGYVGLPLILNISKRYECVGFDTNKKRVENLNNKIDTNKEFSFKDFKNKKINFTNNLQDIKKCNFFILCVPTPIFENKKPDLRNLNLAIELVSKILKKGDILFIESTIYPGLTFQYMNYLQKKTKLKINRDFYIGYSPERVNPGDKVNTIDNINKIVSINTNNKKILTKVSSVYKTVCKKIAFSNDITAAETAKVIENIQRDLNIALMNEFLLICRKLKINFKEVLKLAKTKWNFLNFHPGLVGGHCLPVDPYYLASIAKQNNLKTIVTLAGRKTNDFMDKFVINEIKSFLKRKKKKLKKTNILIIGLSYKAGIADLRNSINLKIYETLKKKSGIVDIYDPFINNEAKKKFNSLAKININNNYDLILFLSKNDHFKTQYKILNNKKNKLKIMDPFEYYE
ncbi:nucleotide sugar dehydrogenase [Pelagibacterales bacterium SAG-MED01]|nr:nucleotide sugar dehydrogenase [Pelagibacterales bacterium SAG-MED01]